MANEHIHKLRSRAESVLTRAAKALPPFADPREIVHELQLHQIELELQNEELRNTQLELETSRERYRDLFDLAPVGYVVHGPNGMVEANLTFADMLGVRPATLVGVHLADFVVPADLNDFLRHHRSVLDKGKRERIELRLVTRSGEVLEVRLESVRTSDATKQYRTAVVDVTEERRLERQLVAAASADECGPVTRGMAHDFGHVLMSLVAQADRALARLAAKHPSREPLDELKRVAADGAIMVTRLLEQARLAGSPELSLDLDREIRRLEPALRRTGGSSVSLRFDANAAGLRVPLSTAELGQILDNLVANARDAMPDGGELMLRTLHSAASDTVILDVADTGAGMDWETQAHAFEPFFTTKAGHGGNGLGLSTVYAIVKRAGGQLRLRSAPARGTTIEVVLPSVEPPSRASESWRRTLTVLVVEADSSARRAARRALEDGGYDVLEAANAEEALEILRSDPDVHVLLADDGLAGIGGLELTRRARELVPGVRLMLSGRPPAGDVQAPDGMQFVPKPFNAATLRQCVHCALVESAGELPTVLVVEDDPRTLLAYQELLWSEGFRMLAAKSSAEAVEVFRRRPERIAAMLTDLRLPDGLGSQLATELRGERPDLPVLLVSGEPPDLPELRSACVEPRTELIAKPVEIVKLATALRRMIVGA